MAWNPSRNNSWQNQIQHFSCHHAFGRMLSNSPGYKQAGLYFKRLNKHLKRCHPGKSRQDNFVLPVKRPADPNLVKNTDPERRKCEVIGCRYYGVAVCTSRQTPEERPQNYNQGAGKERVDGGMFIFFLRRLRQRRQLPFW